MAGKGMTDEQKKFLEECENEFKDRYTEKDTEFMKVKSMEKQTPPIVDRWYETRYKDRGGRHRYSDRRYPYQRRRY